MTDSMDVLKSKVSDVYKQHPGISKSEEKARYDAIRDLGKKYNESSKSGKRRKTTPKR